MTPQEALLRFQTSGRDIPGPDWYDYDHPLWRDIDPDAAHALGCWIGQHSLPWDLLNANVMAVKRQSGGMVELYRANGGRSEASGGWVVALDGEGRPVCSGPELPVDAPAARAVHSG